MCITHRLFTGYTQVSNILFTGYSQVTDTFVELKPLVSVTANTQ